MELFKGWFHDHFLKHAVSARPLLLLLDGHSTHYNPDVIRLAKQNDVIIITLVPHTTHEMQPLDTSVFALLKGHWRDVCHEFLQSNPGKVISKYQFSSLLSKAWFKSLNPTNIINGFKYSGIHVYPFNPEVALERIYPTSGPSNAA
uniref:DDE-1 domain-containing protein n=1 Tax=Amphimedon queenslandica TaxID=400682 RepID=A0A1X7TTT4_AMPQE